jgi:hypothetical protein
MTPADEPPIEIQYGFLAKEFGGETLPLEILDCRVGYYIGTCQNGQPYSRESVEYYRTREKAAEALTRRNWTQRLAP